MDVIKKTIEANSRTFGKNLGPIFCKLAEKKGHLATLTLS